MELCMKVHNVKLVNDFTMNFPLDKGLYAITGENASGKSTLVACASTVFFTMPMYEYFGRPDGDAFIEFTLGNATRKWHFLNGRWQQEFSHIRMGIKGFYEGSIVFGNRFKDTTFATIKKLDTIKSSDLEVANKFIKDNLGLILHDDEDYYNQLLKIKSQVAKENKLKGEPYFLKIGEKYISQIRMSTGENLLISILNSIHIVCRRRQQKRNFSPCIVFLDEIELALHASALRRLVNFLEIVSEEYNLAIFFSTHSLELIRSIDSKKIYYLHRHVDYRLEIINPCYPAFATRNLYSDDGYGNDAVILVEDELAKELVNKLLIEKSLLNNMRVKVLPTGGWANVIMLAHDVINTRLLLKGTKILLVLDKDIENDVMQFFKSHRKYKYLEIDFLPISSLEKYLKEKLIDNIDQKFYSRLENYVFHGRPLNHTIRKYKTKANWQNDKDGKTLFNMLNEELRNIQKSYSDLIQIVVMYLIENNTESVNTLTEYLRKKLN